MEIKRKTITLVAKLLFGTWFAFLMLLPIYMIVSSSLKPADEIFDMRIIPKDYTFGNYLHVLKDDQFYIYMKNSFIVASLVTVIALLFHSMAGYALARLEFPGRHLIFIWILSTLMVPFAVILIPLYLIVRSLGWLNSFVGVIVPAIPHAYGIFLFRQFYLDMPSELEEAAKIDGASILSIYWQIFLPLSKPIAMALGAAFFIANWNHYLWPLIINQDRRYWLIQVAVANYAGEHGYEWEKIITAGVIAVLPIVILFIFFQKYIVEGIKLSGIK